MAVTGAADVFVPQVVGDVATDILFKKMRLLNSGLVRDARQDVFSEGGNKILFPYWKTVVTGLVQDNPGATRTGVAASKLEMDSYEETLASKIVSIDMDKNMLADIATKADVNGHVAKVVGKQSMEAIQSYLIGKCDDTDLELSLLGASTKTLNVDAILEAKLKRTEFADDSSPVLFVHSKQYKDLAQSSDWKTLGTAATTAIVSVAPGAAGLGVVGSVHGVWVALMDSVRNQAAIPAISSITRSSAVATVTTASAHSLKVGDEVTISGAVETEYNGTFTVATVPTTTTFTYAVSGTPTTPATGTPVFTANYTSLMIWPEAVGFYPKKEISGTIKDVYPGTTVFTVDWDFRYGATLYREQPRGVVRLRTR